MSNGGFSATRLARLRPMLEGYVEQGVVPGAVALISRRGEEHVEAVGDLALDGGGPMRRDAIFRIASVTKPITAAAALILVEDCKLRLDEPLDALLPELANRKVLRTIESPLDDVVPANRPLTLRDLLTFTAGYGIVMAPPGTHPIQRQIDQLGLTGFGPPDISTPLTPDEWIARVGTLPLLHQPGEQWLYNAGSYILGVLIARASGQPFEDFLRERVFEPLGMRDSGFSVPPNKLDRLTTMYWTSATDDSLDFYDGPADSRWARPPAFPDGGGGLLSTLDDLHAFATMLLNGGCYDGRRILSRPSVELMTADHLTPEVRAASFGLPWILGTRSWGMGLSVVIRRDSIAATPGKYGWEGGFGTSWQVDPSEQMITILLTQAGFVSADPPNIVVDFWTTAYQAIDD